MDTESTPRLATAADVSPHEVELIRYRDNRSVLCFKLVGGEELRGAVRWFDDRVIRIVQEDRSEITLYQHAIAYYSQVPR